jgi:hypothetical protein
MGWVLRQIAHLYRIEDTLRKNRAGPRMRAAVRAHQSRPICQRIHGLLTKLKMKGRYFPKSGPGQAINYLLNLWPQLCVYLDNGHVEIDQNRVENVIQSFGLRFLCRGVYNAEKRLPKGTAHPGCGRRFSA